MHTALIALKRGLLRLVPNARVLVLCLLIVAPTTCGGSGEVSCAGSETETDPPPRTLRIEEQPTAGTVGIPLSPSLRVALLRADGVLDRRATNVISVKHDALSGTTAILLYPDLAPFTDGSGAVAEFWDLVIDQPGTYRLWISVDDPNVEPILSALITITSP